MSADRLYYDMGAGVEAFSTLREWPVLSPEEWALRERPEPTLPYPVIQAHQTHQDRTVVIDSRFLSEMPPAPPGTQRLTSPLLEGVDALVCDVPECAIGVRTADCIPVLLYDPEHRVVAAVHCGWRSTVLHLSQKTLAVMAQRYGTRPAEVRAVIGPGIGFNAFQVGSEVVYAFRQAGFPMKKISCYEGPPDHSPQSMIGGLHIDLWMANRWLLRRAGVPDSHIHTAGICTWNHTDRFCSARREGIHCPRILNVIKLKVESL